VRQVVVYDIEIFPNLFELGVYFYKTGKYRFFIIHNSKNEISTIYEFLDWCKKNAIMVGFNNEGFDYPLLHHLLNHRQDYIDSETIAACQRLYNKGQEVIESEFSRVWDTNKFIP